EDGDTGLLAQDATDLEPAELGQHQVEHDEVGTHPPRLAQCLGPGARLADREPFLGEVVTERLSDALLVLDDEDAFGRHPSSSMRPVSRKSRSSARLVTRSPIRSR